MRYLIIFSLLLSIMSCNKSQTHNDTAKTLDTIFGGDLERAGLVDKKLRIFIDNGMNSDKMIFKINEPKLIRIKIPRLSRFIIYPSEIIGADISKVDTCDNCFFITPKDSIIRFSLNHYYEDGQVIVYSKVFNDSDNKFDEIIIPQVGFKFVAKIDLRTK